LFTGLIFDESTNYDLSFLAMGCAVGVGFVFSVVSWILNGPSLLAPKNEEELEENTDKEDAATCLTDSSKTIHEERLNEDGD
jgi:hypothetical protein